MHKSLLEKAREYSTHKMDTSYLTDDDMELALAWANSELSLAQARSAWGMKTTTTAYIRIALCLREIIVRDWKGKKNKWLKKS